MQLVTQEYFHAMFGGNNWHSGSGAGNHTFLAVPFSFSITGQAQTTVCGWDRYMLGWKDDTKSYLISALDISSVEVPTDITIQSSPTGGTFILRDFITTGDAVRIKLPYINWSVSGDVKNQYLWLENHRKISQSDVYMWENNACKETASKGMYAYLQVGKDFKTGNLSDVYPSQSSNSFKNPNALGSWLFPLPADGSYDYKFRFDFEQPGNTGICCNWGNTNIPVDKSHSETKPDPLTGYSDLYMYINYNGDDKLYSGDVIQSRLSEVISNQVVHNCYGYGDADDAFRLTGNSELSISTNPAPVPIYTYTFNHDISPPPSSVNIQSYENRTIWLNGLSVIILEEDVFNDGSGAIKVQISWDERQVDNDVRWCGNIKLSPNDFNSTPPLIQSSQFSLNLMAGNTVHIDRGLSPTQHIGVEQINGEWVFTVPTVFTCLPNSYYHMESGSVTIVDNGSTFILESGSKLEIHEGSQFIVRNGSKLIIEDGAILHVHPNGGALVLIENGAELIYKNQTSGKGFILAHTNDLFTPNVAEIRIEGTLTTTDNTDLTFEGGGFISFYGNGNLNLGNNSHIVLNGSGPDDLLIKLGDGVVIITHGSNYNIQNGRIEIGNSSSFWAFDCALDLTYVHFISFGGSNRTILGNSITALNVSYCNFENFFRAFEVSNGPGGTQLPLANIIGSTFINAGILGFSLRNVATVNFNDNILDNSGLFAAEFKDVDVLNINNSRFINNTTEGLRLINVGAAYIDQASQIRFNNKGIYAVQSNIFLRNKSVISDNITGIEMHGNPADLAMLTVGDVGCGRIYNNQYGVIGQDILLNIDADYMLVMRVIAVT